MRPRTLFWTIFYFCCAIVVISAIAPKERPETEYRETEKFKSAHLSADGTKLLLRSPRYVYEFSLPPNDLSAAFAWDLYGILCRFSDINIDSATEEATINFDVYSGNYSRPVPKDRRTVLSRFGFVASNRNDIITAEGQERYMDWDKGRDLKGKRYPPGSLMEPTGSDLSRCLRWPSGTVIVKLDPETYKRNRLINNVFYPFRVIREKISYSLLAIAFVIGG